MAGQYLTPFDSVFWHCEVGEPTHEAPDGSLYFQKGFPDGDIWLRRNQIWVRLGGAAEVLVVPTVAQARITGHTGYHPAIICQTHGGGVDGLTPRYDDGGGRLFFWDQLDTTSPDNGGTVIRTSTTGAPGTLSGRCLKANVSGPVPITWFGAISDARTVVDAAITQGTSALSSASAAWNVGDTVLVLLADTHTIRGTFASTAGSKMLFGTSSFAETDMWIGAPITANGVNYTVSDQLSGTLAISGTAGTGTGTKFLTECYPGQMLGIRGGTTVGMGGVGVVAHYRKVVSIASDTSIILTDAPGIAQTTTGCLMTWMLEGDSTVINYTFAGTRTGTFTVGETVTQAATLSTGKVISSTAIELVISNLNNLPFNTSSTITGGTSGATFAPTSFTDRTRAAFTRLMVNTAAAATASGFTVTTPKRLAATVLSVAGTVATISAPATRTVTGAVCFMGTGAKTAIDAALAAHDEILIPGPITKTHAANRTRFQIDPGSFIVEDEIEIGDASVSQRRIVWERGARLITADTIATVGPGIIFQGDNYSFLFGGGEGHNFDHQEHVAYVGPPRRPIIHIARSGATSVGSALIRMRVRQRIDVTTDEGNTGFAGTGGVIGARIGSLQLGGAASVGKLAEKLCVIDCYNGLSIGGGCQIWIAEDIHVCRYNNGYVGAYTQGFGIGVGADAWYETTQAAITAGCLRNVLVQGHRTGVAVSNAFTQAVSLATFTLEGKSVIENLPETHPCYVRLGTCGEVHISGIHGENETNTQRDEGLLDYYSFDSIVVGAPNMGAAVQGLVDECTIHRNYLNGAGSGFALYAFDGLVLGPNHNDQQGAAQGPLQRSAHVRNIGGGTKRKHGVYYFHLKPGGGVYNTPTDIHPDLTGFDAVHAWNNDDLGNSHPKHWQSGKSTFEWFLDCPTYTGTKSFYDSSFAYGAINFGDDDTVTSVSGDSAAGQTSLSVASVAGFKVGAKIRIAKGTAREEEIIVESFIGGSTIVTKTNLAFTHTAVQADQVEYAITFFVAKNASFTWTLPDGGFAPNFYIDSSSFNILPKYPATALADNLTGLSINWNVWNGATSASVSTNFRADLRVLSHNPLHTNVSFTYRGLYMFEADDLGQLWLGAETLGPAVLYGTGDPNGVRTAPPSSIYFRTDDGTTWTKLTGTGNTGWVMMAAGSFVPTARTVFGTSPIRINGGASATLAADITISALLVTNTNSGIATAITGVHPVIFSSLNGTSGTWNTFTGLGIVPDARSLTGTSPIQIDAASGVARDLTANRTISILDVSNATSGAAPAITAASTLLWSSGGTSSAWATLATIGIVPTARTLTTTFPIRIDGGASADLSANRTLALATGTDGFVLTMVSGAPAWAAPAGGFVPTSRSLITVGPIAIDGTPGGTANLSADRTLSVLDATTSNIGVVQLADDLAGSATAPDVVAATGASGTFTIRCVNVTFASNGLISTASSSLVLNPAGALLLATGSGAIVLQPNGSNLLTVTPTGQLVIENVTTGIGSQPGSFTMYSAAGRLFWWGSNSGAQSVDWTCNSASTASAGGGQTVPGSVAEYMTIFFAGNIRKIPLFAD